MKLTILHLEDHTVLEGKDPSEKEILRLLKRHSAIKLPAVHKKWEIPGPGPGRYIFGMSKTPSDHRGWKNALADLKRLLRTIAADRVWVTVSEILDLHDITNTAVEGRLGGTDLQVNGPGGVSMLRLDKKSNIIIEKDGNIVATTNLSNPNHREIILRAVGYTDEILEDD
jgi:hypothetical protein